MGVQWTEEQQKVISLRDRNILVSAAAGSGKTAVLVQRILSRIMDPDHPVDIDRMLIMTFTRAAAGEMRERISRAIEQALYEDPDNEHLQRQITLIHTAQITTIDGFCSYVIRNYFHLIGLDPGYRTADEGELKLLRQDVLKELIEEHHQKGDAGFRDFVDSYSTGKTDEGIGDLIQKVYEAAVSHPDPDQWLSHCLEIYHPKEGEEAAWMIFLWKACLEELEQAEECVREAIQLCLSPTGPYLYEEALNSDLETIRILSRHVEERQYDAIREILENLSFARLSAKKMPDADERTKEQVKALREEAKEILKNLGKQYFAWKEQDLSGLMEAAGKPLEVLVELVREFRQRFAEKKRDKNVLDFTDMEHMALQILMEKKGDTFQMTQAARELSEKYDEVLVDEYQDSNLVQEYLTNCVSGWAKKQKNTFMVGDVKQSIYRFRLARPELFMGKYKCYTLNDSDEQRIDLHKNFRSRKEVLESVNYIFRQVMGSDLGGVDYDDAAALYPGAVFPEGQNKDFVRTEVLLIEKDGEELEDEASRQTSRELEAMTIAQEIRRMMEHESILDKETGVYRPVEYSDIAILLRTASGWADVFAEVLASQGIPAYTASRTGYFSAVEVVTILNFLRICDNPLQDIPLTSVLRSPIVGCSAQELAEIRLEHSRGPLYDSVLNYVQDGQIVLFPEESPKEELKEKLRQFLTLLEHVRELASWTPIHEVILYVLEVTGYGNYVRALPGGEQRSANLRMLVEKAMEYEKTSYRGLFNFVRYIENLQKYEVDFGEVNLSGGTSAVQIMTIHKSKGLEFPIVFAAGMGKQFNFQDINAGLLVHPDLGFGADAVFPEKRVICSTLYKQLIRRELLKESLGEELRVLYVAMTRAKEKLILTGTAGKLEKLAVKLSGFGEKEEVLLPAGTRLRAKNFWDFVLPSLARHRCMDEFYQAYGIFPKRQKDLYQDAADFDFHVVTALELAGEEVRKQAGDQMQEEFLKNWDENQTADPRIREAIEERFAFQYPYWYRKEIPVKVSVSELKKREFSGGSEKEEALFFEPDLVPLIPRFASEQTEETFRGAARGTAYHRLMECLDYGRMSSKEEIREQKAALVLQNKMSQQEADCIREKDILDFAKSTLGRRMQKASAKGALFREQPFVISTEASRINPAWPSEEPVLVQGIIDAYFQEEEELILVDYKTDRVMPGEEQRLIDLYHIQLEEYAEALERMLKKSVTEIYIYSFTLGKVLELK